MAAKNPFDKTHASVARREGLGGARGLLNGFLFTIGFWLALTGLLFLIFR